MGRKKKSDIEREVNTTQTIKYSSKRSKARDAEMLELWSGMKRCMECGFALATVDSVETYEEVKKVNGVERRRIRPVYPKEDGLHSSYHGKFIDCQLKYGEDNILKYKDLSYNEKNMKKLLKSIKENDIVEDITAIPQIVEEFKDILIKVKNWIPSLQSSITSYPSILQERQRVLEEKALVLAREKAKEIKNSEIKEYLKYQEFAERKGERVEPFEDIPMEIRIQNCYSVVTLPQENCIEEKVKELYKCITDIEKYHKNLDKLYKNTSSLEGIDDIIQVFVVLYKTYILLFTHLKDFYDARFNMSENEVSHSMIIESKIEREIAEVKKRSLLEVDFESMGISIVNTYNDLMENNKASQIMKKINTVEAVLHAFFATEFTKSLQFWDMRKPHPKFEDYCTLLWNTSKFLQIIRPYMTEYQFLTYTRNNKCNRRLVDCHFVEAPFYFNRTEISSICKKCLIDNDIADETTVTKEMCSKKCEFCKNSDCDVQDFSYMDALIFVDEEDEDSFMSNGVEIDSKEIESALTAIGSMMKN